MAISPIHVVSSVEDSVWEPPALTLAQWCATQARVHRVQQWVLLEHASVERRLIVYVVVKMTMACLVVLFVVKLSTVVFIIVRRCAILDLVTLVLMLFIRIATVESSTTLRSCVELVKMIQQLVVSSPVERFVVSCCPVESIVAHENVTRAPVCLVLW